MRKLYFITLMLSAITVLLSACSNEQDSMPVNSTVTKKETAIDHAKKHLDPKYVCPMHPQIVRDEPGNCPICGMDLVEKEAEESVGDSGVTVRIAPMVENNMGVRTAQVARDKLWRRIDTVGYVDFDEDKISHIHIRTQGWIEKLRVKSEGEKVSKGDLLFEFYSPDLVNAQEEYVQAINSGNKRLIGASSERLLALDISRRQITDLARTRKVQQYIQVYAPQDGVIAKLNVREGMFVTPNLNIISLADLSSVWLLAEVFESQTNWVKEGQPAEVTLSYLPGKVWEGKVEYIYPSLDAKTRTLKARLRFDNPGEKLKPNMFANVVIYGGAKKEVLVVPRESLIRTGNDARVIVSMGMGRYQPRDVTAGIESGDRVEIIRGLEEGETIVTSGQFLIDSEASLKASIARMTAPDTTPETRDKISASTTRKILGHGVLLKLMPAERKVNMRHEPIPEIEWPEMTMDFDVKADVALDQFKPDDKVEFELEKGDDGYVIKSMHSAR